LDISDFAEDDEYDEETKTETSIDTTKKRRWKCSNLRKIS
jgi:hypothetical protein